MAGTKPGRNPWLPRSERLKTTKSRIASRETPCLLLAGVPDCVSVPRSCAHFFPQVLLVLLHINSQPLGLERRGWKETTEQRLKYHREAFPFHTSLASTSFPIKKLNIFLFLSSFFFGELSVRCFFSFKSNMRNAWRKYSGESGERFCHAMMLFLSLGELMIVV